MRNLIQIEDHWAQILLFLNNSGWKSSSRSKIRFSCLKTDRVDKTLERSSWIYLRRQYFEKFQQIFSAWISFHMYDASLEKRIKYIRRNYKEKCVNFRSLSGMNLSIEMNSHPLEELFVDFLKKFLRNFRLNFRKNIGIRYSFRSKYC